VLVERREGAALETSWGNAGMIAPGHAFVWSSSQAPMVLLKSLFMKNQALRFSAIRRSPAVVLVPALPAPMHAGAGADQYAAQAPPVPVFAEDPA
jgi:hypothetical protein